MSTYRIQAMDVQDRFCATKVTSSLGFRGCSSEACGISVEKMLFLYDASAYVFCLPSIWLV